MNNDRSDTTNILYFLFIATGMGLICSDPGINFRTFIGISFISSALLEYLMPDTDVKLPVINFDKYRFFSGINKQILHTENSPKKSI